MRVDRWSLLLFVGSASALCLASSSTLGSKVLFNSTFAVRERQLWVSALHDSDLAATLHPSPRTNCEASRPPEPLATPDPLLDSGELNTRVSVSFIIGTDGRVYSPLILRSASPIQDRTILDAVRSWRYRPATCNGAATETESKIEFSSR